MKMNTNNKPYNGRFEKHILTQKGTLLWQPEEQNSILNCFYLLSHVSNKIFQQFGINNQQLASKYFIGPKLI